MRLKEYLEALRNCTDDLVEVNGRQVSRYTAEHGVYDNWPISINLDIEKVVVLLTESGKFEIVKPIGPSGFAFEDMSKDETMEGILNYKQGTVRANVYNSVRYVSGTEADMNRQKRDFQSTILLHPYQGKAHFGEDFDSIHPGIRMPNTFWQKAMALAIIDIGEMILEKKLAVYFPKSIGTKYADDAYSKIVYHP